MAKAMGPSGGMETINPVIIPVMRLMIITIVPYEVRQKNSFLPGRGAFRYGTMNLSAYPWRQCTAGRAEMSIRVRSSPEARFGNRRFLPTRNLQALPKYVLLAQYLGGIIALWITLNVFQRGFSFVFKKYSVFYGDSWIVQTVFAAIIFLTIGAGEKCSRCGLCSKDCFMGLNPMEELIKFGVVKDPNCINCLNCVSKCPRNAPDFTTARKAPAIAPSFQAHKPKMPLGGNAMLDAFD